jgi:hypothetical protein
MSAIRFSGFGLIIWLRQEGADWIDYRPVSAIDAFNTVPDQKQFAYKMLEIAWYNRYREDLRKR